MESLFISDELLEPLDYEKFNELIRESQSGSIKVREELVKHNLKSVIYLVNKKFYYMSIEDRKDLVSEGIIGLLKAIDTFNVDLGYKFSTYSMTYIYNEMLHYLRGEKRFKEVRSLDEIIFEGKDNGEFTLLDSLQDEFDIVLDYENKETALILNNIIKELTEKDGEIIKLYFGFYGKRYTQCEISKIYNVNQGMISRKINYLVKEIKDKMVSNSYTNPYIRKR